MKIKARVKEVVLECESEQQARELFESYRKQNFHLVSKKVLDPKTNSMVVKLIRFADAKPDENLDTVWENFVTQMREIGFSSPYITTVLESIKAKDEFWKTHPEDHLHNVIFDITRFQAASELSQRLCMIANQEPSESFWCSLQKSLKYYVKEKGFFVIAPEGWVSNIKDLSVSDKIVVQGYNPEDLSLQKLSSTLEGESGIWLIPPDQALELGADFINGVTSAFDFSVLLDSALDLDQFKDFYDIPCSLVGEYREGYLGLIHTLEESYFRQLPISFFWNGEALGEVQNPERQTILALEEVFDDLHHTIATVA
ncbi:MAG: hypothetical protein M9899_10330 [Bdellovibrionaceae bacterium]|nr:hypothetical protein [Pseudobdellovibrionaceae bacterium]